jgi:hypothetical protein
MAASPPHLFQPTDTVVLTQSKRNKLVIRERRRVWMVNIAGAVLLYVGMLLAWVVFCDSQWLTVLPLARPAALFLSVFASSNGLALLWLRRFSWRAVVACGVLAVLAAVIALWV